MRNKQQATRHAPQKEDKAAAYRSNRHDRKRYGVNGGSQLGSRDKRSRTKMKFGTSKLYEFDS